MKNNFTTFLVALCLVTGFYGFGQEKSGKKYIEDMVSQDYASKKFVGLSCGVINKEGKTWIYNKGQSNKESKVDFDSKTISRIASVTKIFTAVAVLQLVEKKLISLDTKVGSIIPEFNVGNKAKITVKHLLQNSSGIPHYANKKEINNKINYLSFEGVLEVYAKRPLLFEPGTQFEYSVYGYQTLGIVIEKITGITYGQYLKENIFLPAKMNNTSIELFGEKIENKSLLYHKKNKRKTVEVKNHNISNRIPAGGILTTLEDLLLFGNAVVTHKIISSSSLELMMTNSGLVKKPNNPYGLGLRIYGEGKNMGRIVGHNGHQLGSSAFLFLFPDRGIATAVISNTSVYNGIGSIGIGLFEVSHKL